MPAFSRPDARRRTRRLDAFVALVLTGCATSGAERLAPGELEVGPDDTILVRVVTDTGERSGDARVLEATICSGLEDSGFVGRVRCPSTPAEIVDDDPDVEVNVTLTEVWGVSRACRYWLGAFAGRASYRATADLRAHDRDPALVVSAHGKSGFHAFAGDSYEAIDRLASALVDELSTAFRVGRPE